MAWVLRITDTVPLANRDEYIEAWKEAVEKVPPKVKHIGSWRVAYGRALDFMHLFEVENMADFSERRIEWSEEALESGRRANRLLTDSQWEWLAPLGE